MPSAGRALTGRASPSPAIIRAVTRRTNSGASAGTAGRRSAVAVTRDGTGTSTRWASVASTASQLRRTTGSPRRP